MVTPSIFCTSCGLGRAELRYNLSNLRRHSRRKHGFPCPRFDIRKVPSCRTKRIQLLQRKVSRLIEWAKEWQEQGQGSNDKIYNCKGFMHRLSSRQSAATRKPAPMCRSGNQTLITLKFHNHGLYNCIEGYNPPVHSVPIRIYWQAAFEQSQVSLNTTCSQ
jgi:hypothetical protein